MNTFIFNESLMFSIHFECLIVSDYSMSVIYDQNFIENFFHCEKVFFSKVVNNDHFCTLSQKKFVFFVEKQNFDKKCYSVTLTLSLVMLFLT